MPSSERDGAFGSELIKAALDSGKPAIPVAQENTGSIWHHRAKLGGAAWPFGERCRAGKRPLTIGCHDRLSRRSAHGRISNPLAMFINQPSTAFLVRAGTPRLGFE